MSHDHVTFFLERAWLRQHFEYPFYGRWTHRNFFRAIWISKKLWKCTFSALLRALLKALISYTKSKKTHHHCFSAHRKLFKRFLIKILCSTDWHGHGEYVTYPQHVIIRRGKCSMSIWRSVCKFNASSFWRSSDQSGTCWRTFKKRMYWIFTQIFK